MTTDDFIEHVTRVRVRFASALAGKIAASFADLQAMAGGGRDTVELVIAAHRRLHEISGLAPTLDFPRTGSAAGLSCTAIREAAKAKRPMTPEEAAAFKSALEALRSAAAAELQAFSEGGKADAS
jgi:hypothetical protein